MKKIIIMVVSLLPWATYASESVDTINKAAEQACKGNNDRLSCKKMVLAAANFSMVNTGFYVENCLSHVETKNKEPCDDAKSLINYLQKNN